MNSKMTTNSQLSQVNLKNKKKKQTKETTTIGTQSEKWTSHGGILVGNRKGKVQGRRSIIGRHKIDGVR